MTKTPDDKKRDEVLKAMLAKKPVVQKDMPKKKKPAEKQRASLNYFFLVPLPDGLDVFEVCVVDL